MATRRAIKSAVKDFLTEPAAVVEEDLTEPAGAAITAADLTGVSVEVVNATGRTSQGALAATWLMRQGATVLSVTRGRGRGGGRRGRHLPAEQGRRRRGGGHALGIQRSEQSGSRITVTLGQSYGISGDQIPTATAGTVSAGGILDAAKWTKLADQVTFPLVAPTFLPGGVSYSFQRAYTIKAGDKEMPAMRVGYRFAGKDVYMGFSATTWTEAPIASPGYKVKGPGGVIFRLVGSSTKCDHVWWIRMTSSTG